MRILAIDPGTEKSAFVVVPGPDEPMKILDKGILPNEELLSKIKDNAREAFSGATGFGFTVPVTHMVIEMVASYGMAVGQSTFETVFWIGRFWQQAGEKYVYIEGRARLFRKTDVAMSLCHSMRAKDANIRQALIDKFGEPGNKAKPGVLYKVASHEWSALALAAVYRERLMKGQAV